jgi:hypothetical protein
VTTPVVAVNKAVGEGKAIVAGAGVALPVDVGLREPVTSNALYPSHDGICTPAHEPGAASVHTRPVRWPVRHCRSCGFHSGFTVGARDIPVALRNTPDPTIALSLPSSLPAPGATAPMCSGIPEPALETAELRSPTGTGVLVVVESGALNNVPPAGAPSTPEGTTA